MNAPQPSPKRKRMERIVVPILGALALFTIAGGPLAVKAVASFLGL